MVILWRRSAARETAFASASLADTVSHSVDLAYCSAAPDFADQVPLVSAAAAHTLAGVLFPASADTEDHTAAALAEVAVHSHSLASESAASDSDKFVEIAAAPVSCSARSHCRDLVVERSFDRTDAALGIDSYIHFGPELAVAAAGRSMHVSEARRPNSDHTPYSLIELCRTKDVQLPPGSGPRSLQKPSE